MAKEEKEFGKEDHKVEMGFEFQEFFNSPPGKYLWSLLEMERGMVAKEMIYEKYTSGSRKGKFVVDTEGDFKTCRGMALGIDRVFDIVKSHINFAKRKEKERREQSKT